MTDAELREIAELKPWGVNTIANMFSPNVYTENSDGRWVLAVDQHYHTNPLERLRAAWWVLTGRAQAVVWPEPGDLEAALFKSPRRPHQGHLQ